MSEVIVLGSINMDIVTFVQRLPVPGETIFGDKLVYLPGGKGANQAVAAARGGAKARLIGKVGNDPFAGGLLEFLKGEGIDLAHVGRAADLPSGTALIYIDESGENTVTVVSGSNAALTPADAGGCDIPRNAVAVSQFEVPGPAIRAFFAKAKAAGGRTILNTAPALPRDEKIFGLADIVVMNETEAGFYAGREISGAHVDAVRALLAFGEQVIVLTLGAEGLVVVDGRTHVRIPGHAVRPVDTTGAGDCFVGNLAAALAAGLDIRTAAEKANAAAALSVQKTGAGPAMPFARETERFLAEGEKAA
jgi:ribokinase